MICVIGSAEAAREIYNKSINKTIPDGWSKIADGGFREVYRGPDGYVYKVCYDYYSSGKNNNDEEFDNYCSIVNAGLKHRGWRIPKVYAYQWVDDLSRVKVTVNVMDYVDGIHEEHLEEPPGTAFKTFGIWDDQIWNYILTPDGYRYIVDLAC